MTTSRPPAAAHSASLIWYARCPTLTALGLVANRGVLQREFLRENVNLVSVRETHTPSVRQGHLDHSLTNLVREADAATALWAQGQNGRSRLLAVGQTWHTVSVVARPGHFRPGSHANRLRDLIGRRLSLPREAGAFSPAQVRALRAWETILANAGISLHDIEFAPVVADHPSVPFGDIARREVEALLGGHTDVAILFGAKGLELARAAHLQELHSFEAEEIRQQPSLAGLIELRALTVDQPLLEGDPQIVERITARLIAAADWARRFPREALRQIAIEGRVEEADAAAAYGSLIAEGAQLGLEAEKLTAIEGLQTWMKSRHLVPDDQNVSAWLSPDVVAQAQKRLKVLA